MTWFLIGFALGLTIGLFAAKIAMDDWLQALAREQAEGKTK